MESLSAAGIDGIAVVLWDTVSEEDNLGLDVCRSTAVDGAAIKLDDRLIESKVPGGSFGASYEWVDSTVEVGIICYFGWKTSTPSAPWVSVDPPASSARVPRP